MYFKDSTNKVFSADETHPRFSPKSDWVQIDRGEALLLSSVKKDPSVDMRARLKVIDTLCLRPLRAVAAGAATQEDLDKIAALESEAASIRLQLAGE